MDIGKSIGYVFEDEKWGSKVLLGGIINLIPIVNLAVTGYAVRALKNVANGWDRPLPEWDDFGGYFVKGLLVHIGVLIYSLPLILLNLGMIPLGLFQDQRGVGEALVLVSMGMACLQVLYGLVIGLWVPAAIANYSLSGEFGAFFQFGQIWKLISGNLGDYIIMLIVTWVVSMVAGLVGLVLCIIGLTFTMFVYYLIGAHMLGQIARQSGALAEEPVA